MSAAPGPDLSPADVVVWARRVRTQSAAIRQRSGEVRAAAGRARAALSGVDGGSSLPANLDRVMAWLGQHPTHNPSVPELAAIAGLSVRGLEKAFRRHLDSSPLEYARNLRLERVRRELLAADALTTTVTQVAARNGFTHPGRFGQLYRRRYGRTPATDLRRSG